MGAGATLQLVATGPQDAYLIGNPQISFFKTVYRRHTNFSMETMALDFDGELDFGKRASCTVSRLGDLVHRAVLKFTLPALGRFDEQWAREIGLAMIEDVEIEIGGKCIDRHLGEWLHIWNELALAQDARLAFKAMINGFNENTGQDTLNQGMRTVLVPLCFWFSRSTGMALPLVALSYHDVKFTVRLRPREALARSGKTLPAAASLVDAQILIDYVYLDNEERTRFAQSTHEMLIDQCQYFGTFLTDPVRSFQSMPIDFKHPVKELVWAVRDIGATKTGTGLADNHQNDWFNFNTPLTSLPMVKSTKILFNNNERVSITFPEYYTVLQPYFHHTRAPIEIDAQRYLTSGIHVYSFSLHPEDQQPSGSMNFSRLDAATLHLEMDTTRVTDVCEIFAFAATYNILRIANGMAGVVFY